MSHDVVADCLNMIMNAKKAGKENIEVRIYSKFLIEVLKIAKKHDYLDYSLDESSKTLKIKIKEINKCNAIKPRFDVKTEDIDKYIRRYMPARNFGILIISTSKGIMTQNEAYEKNVGGSLIAYFY